MCNGEEKSKMWCCLGQAAFPRPCFHFIPKLIFLKQVLLSNWNVRLILGVSHIYFSKLVCLQAQLLRSDVLYFRPSGVWKALGGRGGIIQKFPLATDQWRVCRSLSLQRLEFTANKTLYNCLITLRKVFV
uniref:Uncharacterized protein n=1 Tax=Myotis myotis TaxID=51298 RepID=A0A7J7U5H7_MYOMY|nr:hypothetical protein mMyoMyo1_008862 [Myotis myotis]